MPQITEQLSGERTDSHLALDIEILHMRLQTVFVRAAAMVLFLTQISAAKVLDFYQLDLMLDDGFTQNSDWGAVDVTHAGYTEAQYFNLSVNGTWQVQNASLMTLEAVGTGQTMTYSFSLGVAPGTDVTQILCAYTITSFVLDSMPDNYITATVNDRG
ncbi:MAG: hypothetical protein AB1486_19460 [Planctomycetota bacterium]